MPSLRTAFAVFLAGCAGLTGLELTRADSSVMTITTPAFAEGQPMPARFAYKPQDISPEVRMANVPPAAKSLVLIVDDPDAPAGLWTHWLVWNLPSDVGSIPEGKVPAAARQGKNSDGHLHYDGPAPPSGTHRYFFHLYALDEMLGASLPSGSDRSALLAAMRGHVIAEAQTFGTYSASP